MKKKNESQGTLLEQLSQSKGQCSASPGTFITRAAWQHIYYAFAETIDEKMFTLSFPLEDKMSFE